MRSEGVEGDNEQGVKWCCLLYTKSPFHCFSPFQWLETPISASPT